jgi:glucose-fructose oxidoreductase
MELGHHLTIEGKTRSHSFAKRDQFAPELLYFSDCIANDRKPEPSGEEGLADVRIIRALYRSAQSGRPVKLEPTRVKKRPSLKQEKRRPPVAKAQLVNAESASV